VILYIAGKPSFLSNSLFLWFVRLIFLDGLCVMVGSRTRPGFWSGKGCRDSLIFFGGTTGGASSLSVSQCNNSDNTCKILYCVLVKCCCCSENLDGWDNLLRCPGIAKQFFSDVPRRHFDLCRLYMYSSFAINRWWSLGFNNRWLKSVFQIISIQKNGG
jgi:hypothetical protein